MSLIMKLIWVIMKLIWILPEKVQLLTVDPFFITLSDSNMVILVSMGLSGSLICLT